MNSLYYFEDKEMESRKMEKDIFAEMVCAAVEKELGENYEVEVKKIRKNNGVFQHALLISCPEQFMTPNINLECFWEAYDAGIPFEVIVSKLLGIYREDIVKDSVDITFFQNYEIVKDRICYRLIGKEGNEDLLVDIPHMEFLDMVICFYYAPHIEELREGIIPIYNSHMEMWGVCTEDLFRLAQTNTPRLFPWKCSALDEIIKKLAEQEGYDISVREDAAVPDIPMKILSNQKRRHGAVCIIYPGVLEEIAAEEGNFYIIPSSVHELIFLQDDGRRMAEVLKGMITEVNRELVRPAEVLTNSLYYYDSAKKKIIKL